MSRLKTFFHLHHISVRINLLLTAQVVAAVVLMTLVSVSLFTDVVAKNKLEIMQAEMDLMTRGLNEQVELVREVALKVTHTQAVQDCLTPGSTAPDRLAETQKNLYNAFSSIPPLNANYIKKALLISNDFQILDALYSIPPYNQYIFNSPSFLRFVNSSASTRISSPLTLPTDGLKNQTINFMTRYLDQETFAQKGYLILSIKTSFLLSGIDRSFGEYFDTVCIVNQEKEVIYQAGHMTPRQKEHVTANLIHSGRATSEINLNGENLYLYNSVLSNYADWVVVGMVSKDRMYANIAQMCALLVCIGLGTIILVIFSGNYLSKRIVRPIQDVAAAMDVVEQGDWPDPLIPDTEDELKVLALGFNAMTENLKASIEGMLSEQEETRKAEILALQFQLEMLQYQINPHFIYNTLNAISAMALRNGQEDIRAAIQSFSMLLKKTLSNRREFFTLTEELECVEDFLAIQRLRFGDIFTFRCTLPPEYAQVLIPRITLQPLVENALFHGISPAGHGCITIAFLPQGDRLQVTVSDDGVGCGAASIAEMTQRKDTQKDRYNNIGLNNISERLTLYFGETYQLQLAHRQEAGTSIFFYLPLS